jgi:glycosidase
MTSWLYSAINYQINPRSIATREPRNPLEAAGEVKDSASILHYLTTHLDVLQDLGVTVLHLMPPFPLGKEGRKGIGSPYAARDYFDVDPEWGTLDEMRAWVRRAHALGFKVIIGMVPNHSSRDHVWIQEHPDYYVRTENGDAAYDLDWSDTAKLDYTNPGLREAMIDVYDFWLSLLGTNEQGQPDGVDGFRLDMAHFINDRSFWDEALPALKKRHAGRELLFLAECYGMENNKDLFRRGMTAAYDDDFYKLQLYFYGLDEHGHSIILPDHESAANNHDFAAKYEAFQQGGLAAAAARCILDYENDSDEMPQGPFLARYTDNHDEGRGVYRFGEGAVRAIMQLAFLSPRAIPFLLSGQEFGAENRPPIHERIQPCDKGRRMLINGHVTQKEGVEFEGNLFARGYEKRKAWYTFYQQLIALRKAHPALTQGSFTLLDAKEHADTKDRTVIAFERSHNEEKLVCLINLGPEPRRIGRSSLLKGAAVYGTVEHDVIAAFSAAVFRLD